MPPGLRKSTVCTVPFGLKMVSVSCASRALKPFGSSMPAGRCPLRRPGYQPPPRAAAGAGRRARRVTAAASQQARAKPTPSALCPTRTANGVRGRFWTMASGPEGNDFAALPPASKSALRQAQLAQCLPHHLPAAACRCAACPCLTGPTRARALAARRPAAACSRAVRGGAMKARAARARPAPAFALRCKLTTCSRNRLL